MNLSTADIAKKVEGRIAVDRQEAEWLFANASDGELSELATFARDPRHPKNQATYIIMAIINYTNVCVAKCDYCAFYRLPHQSGTYLLSNDEIFARIDKLKSLGGTLVGFNGGFHPKLRLEHYAELFAAVRQRYHDSIEFYGMTVAEFMFSCKLSRLDYRAGAKIFREHGSRWVTGGGAEILDDAFRKRHSPGKYKVEDYYSAQQALLDEGLKSTATMVIGFDETMGERFNHLERLRQFQDRQTSGNRLPSFLCWTYKPYHTSLGGREISTREYLRWLALSRIYLHNIPHIRTSVLTKNEDALLGLQFGADDFDLPTEDEVTEKAGATISLDFDKILQAARTIGYEPVLRTAFS